MRDAGTRGRATLEHAGRQKARDPEFSGGRRRPLLGANAHRGLRTGVLLAEIMLDAGRRGLGKIDELLIDEDDLLGALRSGNDGPDTLVVVDVELPNPLEVLAGDREKVLGEQASLARRARAQSLATHFRPVGLHRAIARWIGASIHSHDATRHPAPAAAPDLTRCC